MGKCHDSRELDALRVLNGAGMFTCTRLPGSPRLSEISCAGRWRRAQEDASVQLSVCRACPVGAARNGVVVEEGPTEDVCTAPTHAYTQALLSAVPHPDPRMRGTRIRHRYTGAG